MPAPRNSNQRNQQLHPGVYRRRRIVLLIIVALILWALISGVMAVVGMVSSWFGGTPSATPSQTISEGQPCAVGDVRVDALVGNADATEAESFATGKNPNIWFRLTNVGNVSCTFDAGPAVQFFTIKSGSDLIWDSHTTAAEQTCKVRCSLSSRALRLRARLRLGIACVRRLPAVVQSKPRLTPVLTRWLPR